MKKFNGNGARRCKREGGAVRHALSCGGVKGRYRLLASTAMGAVLAFAGPQQGRADESWTGAASADWFTGGNWNGNSVPTSADAVTINTGVSPPVAINAPGAVSGDASIGRSGTGQVVVTGAGDWATQGLFFGVLNGDSGNLRIEAGGHVASAFVYIGESGAGEATVTGAGSSWTTSGDLNVGTLGTGILTIENGGVVSVGGYSRIGYVDNFGGTTNGQTGTVTVTGANSSLNVSGGLSLGSDLVSGGSSLTIAQGGNVSASYLGISSDIRAVGTLNIGAPAGQTAVAPGTLNASSVQFGDGVGTIVFNHTSDNYVFSPVITAPPPGGPVNVVTNFGEVDVYSGTTTLTAANTYRGLTNVAGGTLLVDGSIALSTSLVQAGGTLGGTGTLGNTALIGGTLAPGNNANTIGTLTVQGDLSFSSASTYKVNVSPAAADRTNVTGAATLGNATVNATFGDGAYVNKRYTILNAANALTDTFGDLTSNAPTGAVSLSYDAHNVFLDVLLGFSLPEVYATLNPDQRQVANALTEYFNSNGGIPGAFFALNSGGLSQLSGELATGAQQSTFNAMTMFMGLMSNPVAGGRGSGSPASTAAQYTGESDALGYASNGKRRAASEREAYAALYGKAPLAQVPVQRWTVWAAGYGGSQTTDGSTATGSNTTTSNLYGAVVGADYRVSPDTFVGFALGGGGTNFSVANSGAGRSDLFQAGAFLRHEVGSAYVTAALAYGWQDITTDRTVTAAGVDRLRASFDANAFSGRVESGYRFVVPAFGGVGLTPYAAGQVTVLDLPSYAEQAVLGASTFALAYGSKDVTDTRSELGLRSDKSFAMADGILTLRGGAAWAHNFDRDRSVAATFQMLPGASFVVNGAAQAADAALVTAAAETRWLNGWSAAVTFEGEFSNVTSLYAGKGTVRYTW